MEPSDALLSIKAENDLSTSARAFKKPKSKIQTKETKTSTLELESHPNASNSTATTVKEKFSSIESVINFETAAPSPLDDRTCQICNRSFKQRHWYESHMTKHLESRSYKCSICQVHFKCQLYLDRHTKRVHTDNIRLYPCDQCELQARSKNSLLCHKAFKHSQRYNYDCERCDNKFKTKSALKQHLRCHESGPCVCDVCGKLYPHINALNCHMNEKHTVKVKDHECELCKKRFTSQRNLEQHGKLHRIKYVCEHCGRECKNRDYFRKHLRTHSGVKLYSCNVCGKTFKVLASQQVHLLTHMGERPYVCDVCGKSFTQRSPMMLHRRKQHPDVNDPAPAPIRIVDLLRSAENKIGGDG